MEELLKQFAQADESTFEKFVEIAVENQDVKKEEIKYNYCPDCQIAMILAGSEYSCANCGQVKQFMADSCSNHEETASGMICVASGSRKSRIYNISTDYTKTQKKFILEQLMQNRANFKGTAIPTNVLQAAATQYNTIQKFITEDMYDSQGNVVGKKKFVRRGNIKDEILAALIYFECIREGLVRKKRDIAIFMRLPNYGFSRGEGIVRELHEKGKIDIPVNEEPIDGFVDRYFEALNMENDPGKDFVVELVEESERKKVGMSSQLSSKAAASLWIYITKRGIKITSQQLERAADNTKKNTFMKFVKTVQSNMKIFAPVFRKHGVPV